MYVNPLSLWLLLAATASGFAIFTFLPSVLEVLRPKDKGPRRILKKPLHQRIRNSSMSQSESGRIGDVGISKDLEVALKDAGVKSQRIGRDTIRVLGNIAFKAGAEVFQNIIVNGSLNAGDHCLFHGSIKSYGNMSMGSSAIVEGNLLSERDITIKNEAVIAGSVHARGSVRIGEKVYVGLAVVAEGNVELFENSEVRNVLTRGLTRVKPSPQLDLPSSMYRID